VVPPEGYGARGTRFCSKSHAGFFNAKKRSEDSKQRKGKTTRWSLIAWTGSQKTFGRGFYSKRRHSLAAINGRLRRVLPVKTYGEWIPKDTALTT
jgi:hypothetical protein